MKIKLNLIPDYRKEGIKKAKRLKFTVKEGFWLAFIFIFIFSGLFCFGYILKMNFNLIAYSVQTGSKKNDYEKIKKMDNDFKQINELVSQIQKIQKNHLYWSNALLKLNRLVPETVAVDNLSTKNYKIIISGISKNRDELLKFKENLEKSDCFEAVSLPLSNLVTKENIDFQIEFSIKKDCLKKQ